MLTRLAAVAAFAILAGSAHAVPPTHVSVLAFFEERGNDAAFQRLKLEAKHIDVLIPETFDFDVKTQRTDEASPPRAAVVTFAHDAGIGIWPAVNAQVAGQQVFDDPAKRSRAIASITAAAANWDGVTLDFEGVDPGDRDGFTTFVTDLADNLHHDGKGLAIYLPRRTGARALRWASAYDYPAIARAADHVLVSSYSENWETAGPVVSTTGYASLLRYLGSISKASMSPTIGTLYHAWSPGAHKPTVGLSDAVGRFAGRVHLASRGGEVGFVDRGGTVVWYETPQGIAARMAAARAAGFQSVGLFILGHEPLSFWKNG
jgi:spore germination protein YaaH